ncbi:MAG: DedA family protein [Patescibacteria group bacterium]
MITAVVDVLANAVIETIDFAGYAGIFFLMLVESCGIPMPSEVIMPFSGFLVFEGKMTLLAIVLYGALGNLVGSWLAYWIGYKGGRPLIEKYGKYFLISKHDLDLADKWFQKWGDWTVFIGRLLPVVRTYISFPAGVAKMDFKKFSIYTFLGALPWTLLFGWLGIKMGANWELIREKLHNFDMAILLVVVLTIVLYVWRHIRQNKKIKAVEAS